MNLILKIRFGSTIECVWPKLIRVIFVIFDGFVAVALPHGAWGLADLVALVTLVAFQRFQPCFGVVYRCPQTTIFKNPTYVLKTQIHTFVIMRADESQNALKARVQMV